MEIQSSKMPGVDVVDPKRPSLSKFDPRVTKSDDVFSPMCLVPVISRGRIVRPIDRHVRRPVEHDLTDDWPPVVTDAHVGRDSRLNVDGLTSPDHVL